MFPRNGGLKKIYITKRIIIKKSVTWWNTTWWHHQVVFLHVNDFLYTLCFSESVQMEHLSKNIENAWNHTLTIRWNAIVHIIRLIIYLAFVPQTMSWHLAWPKLKNEGYACEIMKPRPEVIQKCPLSVSSVPRSSTRTNCLQVFVSCLTWRYWDLFGFFFFCNFGGQNMVLYFVLVLFTCTFYFLLLYLSTFNIKYFWYLSTFNLVYFHTFT